MKKNSGSNKGLALLTALVTIFGVAGQAAWGETKIGTKQGEMYPDFLLPTLDGKQSRFSDYRGKKILLFHFASW